MGLVCVGHAKDLGILLMWTFVSATSIATYICALILSGCNNIVTDNSNSNIRQMFPIAGRCSYLIWHGGYSLLMFFASCAFWYFGFNWLPDDSLWLFIWLAVALVGAVAVCILPFAAIGIICLMCSGINAQIKESKRNKESCENKKAKEPVEIDESDSPNKTSEPNDGK